ncbi:hypothetical protein TWF694_002875 [Orbilia ellipsospora]|uniref:Uncharacterized protein n=1 Tax=Orbilia ellipsospora TaxID=2528407 RepID=A0AAV9X0V0_9PEZI
MEEVAASETPVRQLEYQSLSAGNYQVDDTVVCNSPQYETPPPITLSVFSKKKYGRFLRITFTNWSGCQCEVTLPLLKCHLNLVTEGTIYIDTFEMGGDFYRRLSVLTIQKNCEKGSGTFRLRAFGSEFRESSPLSISRPPMNLVELKEKLIILRGCTNPIKEQVRFI